MATTEQAILFFLVFIGILAIMWKIVPQSKRRYSVKPKPKTLDDIFSPRRYFDAQTKEFVLQAQGHKCNICKCQLLGQGITEFDHIDGDRSNNNRLNCQALCANCHRRKTNEENRFRNKGI